MEHESDEQLVRQYLSGKQTALNTLITRYTSQLYAFSYRYAGNGTDAQDIVQDTFIKAWKALASFDVSKSFKVWIYTIAKNTGLDWLKKKRPELFSHYETDDELNPVADALKDDTELPDELAHNAHIYEELAQAITELPDLYRSVVTLRYGSELSFEEIATVLNKPVETVRSQHRRALIKLKAIVEQRAPFKP